jgi:hypothetical protein
VSCRGAGRPPHEADPRPPGGIDRSLQPGPDGHSVEGDRSLHGDRRPPDLGDLIVVLLAGSMAGLRDRLVADGFDDAAELVADLVELADEYIAQIAA